MLSAKEIESGLKEIGLQKMPTYYQVRRMVDADGFRSLAEELINLVKANEVKKTEERLAPTGGRAKVQRSKEQIAAYHKQLELKRQEKLANKAWRTDLHYKQIEDKDARRLKSAAEFLRKTVTSKALRVLRQREATLEQEIRNLRVKSQPVQKGSVALIGGVRYYGDKQTYEHWKVLRSTYKVQEPKVSVTKRRKQRQRKQLRKKGKEASEWIVVQKKKMPKKKAEASEEAPSRVVPVKSGKIPRLSYVQDVLRYPGAANRLANEFINSEGIFAPDASTVSARVLDRRFRPEFWHDRAIALAVAGGDYSDLITKEEKEERLALPRY